MFIRFDRMYKRDRHMDRQTSKAALAQHRAAKMVIKQQKLKLKTFM